MGFVHALLFLLFEHSVGVHSLDGFAIWFCFTSIAWESMVFLALCTSMMLMLTDNVDDLWLYCLVFDADNIALEFFQFIIVY